MNEVDDTEVTPSDALSDADVDTVLGIAAGRNSDMRGGRRTHEAKYEVTLGDLIAASPKVAVRRLLAENPRCPGPQQLTLAQDPDRDVRRAVAANPATDDFILVAMAGDNGGETIGGPLADLWDAFVDAMCAGTDDLVMEAVACNPSTPLHTLVALSHSTNALTRRSAALSRRLPSADIERLAADPSWRVRKAAAGDPTLKRGTLAAMANDPDEGVRRAVAGNPNAPDRVVTRLQRDDSDFVRLAARENKSAVAVMRQRMDSFAREVPLHEADMIGLPSSAQEFKAALAAGTIPADHTTTLRLAQDHSSPLSWVMGWLDDVASLPVGDIGVSAHIYAAMHPDTPDSQLHVLRRTGTARVRRALAMRQVPDCEDEALLWAFVSDDSPGVRVAVARYATATMPHALWSRLADDAVERVRDAVAANVHAPGDILVRLSLSSL